MRSKKYNESYLRKLTDNTIRGKKHKKSGGKNFFQFITKTVIFVFRLLCK